MCGFVGLIDQRGIDPTVLEKMRDTLRHRGPDDAGLWLNGERTIGLAHRRLSILDLSSAGRQPMSDGSGDRWLVFNGEIYNHRSLRAELEARGYRFRSTTDSEVILHGYREWGEGCLERFNGMFAFLLVDLERRRLLAARDRLGKKPLYHAHCQGRFLWASELKAILAFPPFPRRIDPAALNGYFSLGYVPNGHAIFQGVEKIEPGGAMTVALEDLQVRRWRYWEPPGPDRVREVPLEALESLLEDAVRLRMESDVPLGAFLSGGLDSSLVVAMMARTSYRPVRTFSIGFHEQEHSELVYARQIASAFGTEHTEIVLEPDVQEALPMLAAQFDEPFADSSLLPTYFVSRAARAHVKVALSGDGGDEIFGGYETYRNTLKKERILRRVPAPVRRGAAAAGRWFPRHPLGRKLQKVGSDPPGYFVRQYTEAFFSPEEQQRLLAGPIRAALSEELSGPERRYRQLLSEAGGTLLRRMGWADLRSYLPDDILVKVDRASMLTSLEVRSPLLDFRLVELGLSLPDFQKMDPTGGKLLLKQLARKLLPAGFEIDRKQGFGIPVREWFGQEGFTEIKDRLLATRIDELNPGAIERVVRAHERGADQSTRLFTLLIYVLWHEQYRT